MQQFLEKKEEKVVQDNFASSSEILQEVKREFAIFENSGQRPSMIDKVFHAIQSVPPTSVEAERAFSAAGLFITKIRSRLGDNAIDKLCFLRQFLLKQNK